MNTTLEDIFGPDEIGDAYEVGNTEIASRLRGIAREVEETVLATEPRPSDIKLLKDAMRELSLIDREIYAAQVSQAPLLNLAAMISNRYKEIVAVYEPEGSGIGILDEELALNRDRGNVDLTLYNTDPALWRTCVMAGEQKGKPNVKLAIKVTRKLRDDVAKEDKLYAIMDIADRVNLENREREEAATL